MLLLEIGNAQYQAASAFKNDVTQDGLKGLMPIVATNEHFNTTIQHNGVFIQALVQGWLTGQLQENIEIIPEDDDIQNDIHSVFDYGNLAPDVILNNMIDIVTSIKDDNGFTGMYPNYDKRSDVNASFAPINQEGESDVDGTISRYTNLELPMYHLTGWWDIFIDGQINTYNKILANISEKNQRNQKLVIGPWTHPTIAQNEVGDLVFPPSVFDLNLVTSLDFANANFSDLVSGELVNWFRYLLNFNEDKFIGEPKILIRESQNW